jgi:hypothetical protein
VVDRRGRSYFADLAWLPSSVKLLFEIKGFAAHIRDMNRQKYCNKLNREKFDDPKVVRKRLVALFLSRQMRKGCPVRIDSWRTGLFSLAGIHPAITSNDFFPVYITGIHPVNLFDIRLIRKHPPI